MPFSGKIWIDSSLRGDLRLAYSYTCGLSVNRENGYLTQEIASALDQLCRQLSDTQRLKEFLLPARTLYHRFGLDPTKVRPSSEALLRRVLRSKELPRINSLVDVCNLASVQFGLPVGLYDAQKIVGDVVCRPGWPGESYRGIGKEEIHLSGKPVLADARGPFGNPSSDSQRTQIDLSTAQALFVIFAPYWYDSQRLAEHLQRATERIVRYCGGTVRASGLLPEEEVH
ncbi:MAG: phenylalanine--tRNA ligase beta subunit-related protein [candidate division KSB1 bacterium]|nr:phenylalanine--tRNA ligase beta subunit-related protein [candidate division KSB1 bacterium]